MKIVNQTTKILSLGTAAVLMLPALAHASGSWKIVEEADPILQTDVCRVTTDVVKSNLKVEISISMPKNGEVLPALYFKVAKDASLTEKLASVQLSSKESQNAYMLIEGATDADADVFWIPPQDQARLIQAIRGSSALKLVFNPKTSTQVLADVSLKGSSDTLDQVAKCLKGKDVSGTAFLTYLKTSGNLGNVIPDGLTAQMMFDGVQAAYKNYRSGLTLASSLADLRKAMSPAATKEAAALKVLSGKQSILDASQAKLDASTASLAKSQAQLTQLQADLPNLQQTVVTDQADLVVKKAAYDPVRAQLTPLEADLSSRRSALNSISSQLSQAQSEVSQAQSNIAQLNNEASSLQNQIPSVDSALSQAQNNYQQADNELRRFNPQWELQREMQSCGADQARRDADMKASRARDVASQYNSVLNNALQAKAAFQACQNANPKRDCGPESQRANQGAQDEARVFQDRKHAEEDAQWAQLNAQNLINQAQSRVNQRQSDLNSRDQQAQSQYNDLQNQDNQMRSRLNQITSSEIPSWQSQLSSSRSSVAQLSNAKASATSALAASQATLTNARTALNADAITAAYNASVSALSTAQKAVATNLSTTTSTQKAIASVQVTITQQTAVVTKQTADRDTAKAAQDVISQTLVPQRTQESALLQQIDDLKKQLDIARDLYQQELVKLTADL